MDCSSTDIRADTKAAIDRGETTGLMEPLVLSEGSPHRPALNDLAVELAATSAGFRRGLPPGVVKALADLVRAMNCYYSNLIEGHDTHPVDIELLQVPKRPVRTRGSATCSLRPRRTYRCRDGLTAGGWRDVRSAHKGSSRSTGGSASCCLRNS